MRFSLLPTLLVLMGCQEYNLTGEPKATEPLEEEPLEEEEPIQEPDILVDPMSLDFGYAPLDCPTQVRCCLQ